MRGTRVVSLVPSATETLVALGVTPVACTRFCDLPGARTVGGTKNVDVDAVAALGPDLVVVNDEENRIEDAQALVARGLALHSMSPRSVLDVGRAVQQLAAAVGLSAPEPFDEWDAWVARTRARLHSRAFVPIWRRPWMSLAADTYGSSLLAHCGIENVCGAAAGRYPEVALSDIAGLDPAVVILPSEPYAFAPRHAEEIHAALPGARAIFADGRDLFWWGIRTPDAAARLGNLVP
jgi:ABC-type Fe3+-hydroxamate transport system substrate-binding protein